MSSTSASQAMFNGPFKRAELLLLPQYAASDTFPSAGKWIGTKNHVLSVDDDDADDDDADATVPLYCIVVGTISNNKTYLGKHGNFSTKFMDDAQKAKLQFTVTRPADPDFGPDFDKAFNSFQRLQRAISDSFVHLHFLLKEEGNAMRMNFGLFEPKGETYDKEREKETQAYTVDHLFEPYWSAAKTNNYCSIMPVFDVTDMPVSPNRFAEKLVGAMCKLTFVLKHYSIAGHKKDGSYVEGNDVFSAQVETVAILKNPPVLARSPYKGRFLRKPQHKPQIPTRGEQINAAEMFVPRPDFAQPKLPSTLAPVAAVPAESTGLSSMISVATATNVVDGDPFANIDSTTDTTTGAKTKASGIKPQGSSSSVRTLTSEDGSIKSLDDFIDVRAPSSSTLNKWKFGE